MKDMLPPVVILAAGDFPAHPVPKSLLQQAGCVVCLDSAADLYLQHMGRLPHYVVGDADSASPSLLQQMGHRFIRDDEQETNDLCKAVRFIMRQGIDEVCILGGTGKREDHTLGNIFHLPGLGLRRVKMVTDYGVFLVPERQDREYVVKMKLHRGCQVSVFNLGTKHLRAEGLRWQLRDFTELWEGTLNEAIQENVEVRGEGTFLVYHTHE